MIDFVEADLLDKEKLRKAVKGVDYVIHLANPLPGTKKSDEEETVRTAVEGMETILSAAVEFKVKKVIVTSSLINMMGNVWKRSTGDHHYSEQDYAPYDSCDAYAKSKLA